jgi:hypothetical protein
MSPDVNYYVRCVKRPSQSMVHLRKRRVGGPQSQSHAMCEPLDPIIAGSLCGASMGSMGVGRDARYCADKGISSRFASLAGWFCVRRESVKRAGARWAGGTLG